MEGCGSSDTVAELNAVRGFKGLKAVWEAVGMQGAGAAEGPFFP